MAARSSGPRMVEVSTTMRPDRTIKVTELERETLRRQGILKGSEKDAAEPQREG